MSLNFRVPVMKLRIRPKSVILGYTRKHRGSRHCLLRRQRGPVSWNLFRHVPDMPDNGEYREFQA